jgi:peptide-methionine (R)-S-oxide reductase
MDKEKMPTEEELKNKLGLEAYKVLREKGTEAPYSGKYLNETKEGMYKCVVCGNPLFASDAKFESEIESLRGWPSFEEALPGAVEFKQDDSYGVNRTEVVCAKCGSHLGHIFDDKSTKTGKHFCLNSVCFNLEENK